MCHHIEVLLGSMNDAERLGSKQRVEYLDVDSERVDQGRFLARPSGPSNLDQSQLRVVSAFAMELGIERISRAS